MEKIKNLPNWIVSNRNPSFYETDSGSVLEQTAIIYQKIIELIDSYNLFTENTLKDIDDFKKYMDSKNKNFEIALRQEFQEFINTIDLKVRNMQSEYNSYINEINKIIDEHETRIKNAENYMKHNIENVTYDLVTNMIRNNDISVKLVYDSENESLRMTAEV